MFESLVLITLIVGSGLYLVRYLKLGSKNDLFENDKHSCHDCSLSKISEKIPENVLKNKIARS